MTVTTVFEIYDEFGVFKNMFHEHEAEARIWCAANEPYEDAWEIRTVTRKGIGTE